jgi:hypothetical protein
VTLALLILWNTTWFKKQELLKLIPIPLVRVVWGRWLQLFLSEIQASVAEAENSLNNTKSILLVTYW